MRAPWIVVLPLLGSALTAQERTVVRDVQGLPSYKSLKFPALRAVKIPEPVMATLPNGMKIYLLEDHELPLVSGSAVVRTGNLFDPADKRGLADITANVLRSGGTKAKTGDEIDELLENKAASVESGMGESSATVSFSALKENSAEVLRMFRDVLTSPEFRQDKIDLIKTQYRSAIARRNDDPGGIASREFSSIAYGRDNSYGWSIEYEHIDRIERADLLGFYQRYYFPANILLAVYGDFSASEMKAEIEKAFAGWQPKQPPVPAFPPITNKPAPGVFLATKPDVTQTFFELGHLGGVLNDKDYPALSVAADILGGGFSSRLVRKVRSELGLAYSVSADWGAGYDHPGLFRISGSTKSQSTEQTLRVIREEIEKLRSAEVTPQELATAKDAVLNSFVFHFDRPSKTLNRLVLYDYFGYPKDFIFEHQKAVAAVTRADVLRVARQYLDPGKLTIVAAGNPKNFDQPLTALNLKVEPIDLTIPEAKHAAAAPDAESLEKGKRLLARAQQALGGAAKLLAIKDATRALDATIEQAGAITKVKQRSRYIAPDTLRQDQDLPFGKVSVYASGGTGWLSTPQGVMPMPGPVMKQMQGELFRQLLGVLLSDRDADRTVNYAGDGVLDITDKAGHSVRLLVDEKTGLPLKETYQLPQITGSASAVDESYSDWRPVDGVLLPFKMLVEQDGKKVQEATVEEYKLNTGLKVEDLSQKP